jgi:hypothetical protein
MKYTKAFEKYWNKAYLDLWETIDGWQLADIKRIAFLAWKAGINKTKQDYCLIKPKDFADKFLPF